MADLWEGDGAPGAAEGPSSGADPASRWGEVAARAPVGPERANALTRDAIAAEVRGDAGLAMALRRRALVNDPTQPDALRALLEHAASSEDWVLLSLLQRLRFESAEPGEPRAEIARGIARIERDELQNPAAAREWLQRGLQEAPRHAPLHEELIEIERERGDEAALLQHLETVIRLRRDSAPIALLLEAAERLAARGDRTRALTLLERASSLEPDNVEALDALLVLLRELDHVPELADALERRATLARESPREQAALLAELGALLESRLFDAESALDAYRRAQSADPAVESVSEAVEALRSRLDGSSPEAADAAARAAEALTRCEREAEGTADRERLGALVREIERLHGLRGQPEAAIPWLERWVAAAPEEPKALRALARLQERAGLGEALVQTLEALDRLLDPEAQLPLRRRIAALCSAQGRHADAERFYARALQLDPADLLALEGRAEALRRNPERQSELALCLSGLAELQPDPERLRTLTEIADVHEACGDVDAAIGVLERAERIEEAPPEIGERIDALLRRTNQIEALLVRLEARSNALDPGSADAVSADLRRARLLLDALDRPDEAAALYRRVLEHAPEASEAAAGLERALRAGLDAEGLAQLLAEQEALAESPEERDRLRLERGMLLEQLLDRPSDALEAFRELALRSANEEIAREAEAHAASLLERLARWPELREQLQQRLERCGDQEAVALHERLAHLCDEHLEDDEGARIHLERVVELEPGRADVWQQLAGRYELEARSDDWARALEAELACGPDPARELSLRARLADLYAHALDEPELARAHYERVFELNPSHLAAGQYLIEAYRSEERYEELIELLEARLADTDTSSASDPHLSDRRTALRLQIAEVRETRLDDLEGAISALEVAIEELGPHPRVAEPLAAAYRRAGYDADLIELCEHAADAAAEPSERAGWWVRQGDAHLAREEAEEAAHAYRRALMERPGDRAVEASLRELYRALGRKQPLAELLETELEQLAGAAEIPVRLELVELLRGGDPPTALRHARRILELSPRHGEAYAAALALCDSDEEKLHIVEERRRAARSAIEQRAAGLERARLLAGPLGRAAEAIDAYRELLGAEPGGPLAREMRAELASLLEREHRFAEWLAVWASLCRDADPGSRREKLERAAEIAWDRISPEAALPWLERLRREDCDEAALLARISHAHRQLGREAALLRALDSEARASADPDQARRCQLERAQLLRAAGEGGRALAALAEAGPSPEVLRLREAIERELGLHAQRATTLEALLAFSGGDLDLHRELADLYAGSLAAPEDARRHLEAALDLAPERGTRIELLRALAGLELRLGRLASWARRSEQELAALDSAPVFDERRRVLRRELALAYCERLPEPDRALAHLRRLLDPADVGSLGAEDRERLETACLGLLRAGGQSAELERRLTERLERRGGDASAWLELARLREEALQCLGPAREAYRRALETSPAGGELEALRGLRRTSQQLGAWADVAEALEAEIEHADDDTERGALLRALGDLSWHRLQSTTRASRCYAAALEANGTDFAALRALERLLESMEDWRGAIDLYESEVEVLGSANPKRRREIWLRVATLARDREADAARARSALERAAAIEPLDTARLRDLADLHDAADDRDAFALSFAAWCDADDSPAASCDHLRLAEALEGLGRTGEAAERVERALAAEPEHGGAWETLARLRAAENDAAGSAEALRRAAEQLEPESAAVRLLEAAEKLGEDAGAHDLLREATGCAPDHVRALAALARSAARLGLDDEAERAAAAALDAGAETELEAAEAAAVALLGAESARRRGRLEAAAGLYAEALRCEPDSARGLAGQALTLVDLGDTPAALVALERRLAHSEPDPERALHRALLGRCLERLERREDALVAYGDALDADPMQAEALEACARIYEQQEQFGPGIGAIERWARAARDGTARAARLMRAADWELRRGGCEEAAERHLRQVVAADPDFSRAWIALALLQLERGAIEDAVESTDRGASRAADPCDFAALAALQGRALESRGDRRDAAECFGIAWNCDARRADAALAQARLLRGFGEWREAASVLARFGECHPDRADATLTDVFEQLGRLLAGPLEDLDGAVLSYRRAIELAPERLEARAALAELLSHRPGDRGEALDHLRAVLTAQPTHAGCLRVALRMARAGAEPALAATGIALQRALGIASGYEGDEQAVDAVPLSSWKPALADAHFETLRTIAVEASAELAEALGGTAEPAEDAPCDDPLAALRERMLVLQGELSAPALLARSSEETGEALGLLALLLLEPDAVQGDGQLVNALSGALGRRRRRKIRRLLPDDAVASDFADVDGERWRLELRALAAAELVRRGEAPLRRVLIALLAEPGEPMDLDGESHLAPRVEADPVAKALVARVVEDWLGRL